MNIHICLDLGTEFGYCVFVSEGKHSKLREHGSQKTKATIRFKEFIAFLSTLLDKYKEEKIKIVFEKVHFQIFKSSRAAETYNQYVGCLKALEARYTNISLDEVLVPTLKSYMVKCIPPVDNWKTTAVQFCDKVLGLNNVSNHNHADALVVADYYANIIGSPLINHK